MNVFGNRERSWRKARKRGVSPIIATILLVAITVVLAAVLYVLISGLTTGGSNKSPIGGSIGFGTAAQSSTAAGCAATPPAGNCYSVGISSSSSAATTANINFAVQTSSGTPVTLGTGATLILVSINGAKLATYTFSTGAWAPGTGYTLPQTLASTDTLALYAGSGTAPVGIISGDNLVAAGVGSLQGTISVALP